MADSMTGANTVARFSFVRALMRTASGNTAPTLSAVGKVLTDSSIESTLCPSWLSICAVGFNRIVRSLLKSSPLGFGSRIISVFLFDLHCCLKASQPLRQGLLVRLGEICLHGSQFVQFLFMVLIQVLKFLFHLDRALLPCRMFQFDFFENVPNLLLAV